MIIFVVNNEEVVMRNLWGLTIFLVLSVLVLVSCELDHGLGPVRSVGRTNPDTTAYEPGDTIPGIQGKIYFQGDWPENPAQAFIAASPEYPLSNLLIILNYYTELDSSIFFADSCDYFLRLSNYDEDKEFAIVGFGLLCEGEWYGPNMVKGIYASPDDPNEPLPVRVPAGRPAKNVDIIVDFDNPPILEMPVLVQ